jgi:hydrogenase 3 maturation protease
VRAANPVGEWVVIDGGSARKTTSSPFANYAREPADRRCHRYGLNPGNPLVDPDDIAEMFMMTTHNMPLNYLIDQLQEDVGEVIFSGFSRISSAFITR